MVIKSGFENTQEIPLKCPILLLDGGLGTTLEAPPYNTKFSQSTPLWSSHLLVSSPEILEDLQRDFVRNGADILLTATYQASFEGFAATPRVSPLASSLTGGKGTNHELSTERMTLIGYGKDEAKGFMRNAVLIAQSAFSLHSYERDKKGLIALSLGAYGATMRPSQEYTGDYPPTLMADASGLSNWHAERLAVFTESQQTWDAVDFVAFETIPLLEEVYAIRRSMAKVVSGEKRRKWWISCVFPDEVTNQGYRLPDGNSPVEVIKAMLSPSRDQEYQTPWGVGINCTKVEKIRHLVRSYEEGIRDMTAHDDSAAFGWPWLVLCPDGAEGLVYNTSTQTWDETAGYDKAVQKESWDKQVFEVVMEIHEEKKWKGVIVGGCCKTSPAHIGRLREQFNNIGWNRESWQSTKDDK